MREGDQFGEFFDENFFFASVSGNGAFTLAEKA